MKYSDKKILMIFIEPTPYILDLIEYGFTNLNSKCDVVFLKENLTQNWVLGSYITSFKIIKSKKKLLMLFVDIFIKRKYKLLHLAGWGNAQTLFLIVTSRIFRFPVVVESDTPLNLNIQIWKKIIKRCLYPIIFKLPAFFLPGGTRQSKYLNYYGVKNNKIIKAQMTVNVDYIKTRVNKITADQREKLRLQYKAQKNDVVFLFVGRFLDWKGLRELISAIRLIRDNKARLWIVGAGNLEEEVQKAASMCEKITCLGSMFGDSLLDIYHAADVFMLPSHAEPWGLVVNEAMAAGKPVIASQTVGCVEDLIYDHQNGLIVQPKNVSSLCDAMTFMLENPEKRKIMSKKAFAHISTWTLQNEACNITSAWQAVLNR